MADARLHVPIAAVLLALVGCGDPIHWQPSVDLFDCTTDAQCGTGEVCVDIEGADPSCERPCLVDEDCTASQRCGQLVGDLSEDHYCVEAP